MQYKRDKFERIQLVKELGLNTEESILITKEDKPRKYLDFLDKLDNCSIRLFNNNLKNNYNVPHYPIVTVHEAISLIPEMLSKDYNIILATPIDPKDCAFAGACWKRDGKLLFEIAIGPGTVRRVTHENKIDIRLDMDYPCSKDHRINEAFKKFKSVKVDNVIFEFSWYNNLVGYKKENLICWEITDDGTGKSEI